MNKKGQFYIIMAVIIAIAIFSLYTKPNTVIEQEQLYDFPFISNNFLAEVPKIVNNVIYTGGVGSVQQELSNFVSRYVEYVSKINPNIGLLFIYKDTKQNKILLENHLSSGSYNDPNFPASSQDLALSRVSVSLAGKSFSHQIPLRVRNFGSDAYSGVIDREVDISVAGISNTLNFVTPEQEIKVIVVDSSNSELSKVYP